MLLSLADVFLAGLTPVFAVVLWVLQSKPQAGGGAALLMAGLGAMIVFAALGTLAGHDRARSALLYLLVLYYGLQAFAQVVLATAEPRPEVQLPAAGKVLAMALYLLLNLWYFLRPETLAYYRHPKGDTHARSR
ncbi:MAG: hypothetical protein Fur0018_04250 [Anaerolineales bacterium]